MIAWAGQSGRARGLTDAARRAGARPLAAGGIDAERIRGRLRGLGFGHRRVLRKMRGRLHMWRALAHGHCLV